MTSFFKTLFLLATVSFLAACAKSDGPKRNKNNVPIYEYGNNNEALEASKSWTVTCADRNNCPNTVAQLVMAFDNKVGVCTATLIAHDVAITNSHCFNLDDYKTPESICKNSSVLVFASNSPLGKDVVECHSIIAKSKISTGASKNFRNPDYMILKLKRSLNRGFETVDQQGMEDGLKLVNKKVNPGFTGNGTLVVDTCEIMHGTFMMPAAKHLRSPVHTITRCNAIGGNSGSALFDEAGKIRGLLFAAFSPDAYEKLKSTGYAPFLNIIKPLSPAYATNASCIDLKQTGYLPAECAQGRTEEEQNADLSVKSVEDELRDEYRAEKRDPRFGYALKTGKSDKNGYLLVFRPVCYTPQFDPQKDRNAQLLLASWKVGINIDQRLKISMRPTRTSTQCSYTFTPTGPSITAKTTDGENCLSKPSLYSWGITITEKWSLCK